MYSDKALHIKQKPAVLHSFLATRLHVSRLPLSIRMNSVHLIITGLLGRRLESDLKGKKYLQQLLKPSNWQLLPLGEDTRGIVPPTEESVTRETADAWPRLEGWGHL